jgi:alanyl-tRNA synthetase
VTQNHTATHLLHSALRRVLGEHVMQAGSLVAPDHLRLDFSHGKGLSRNQLDSVESLVNEWVERNYPVRVDKMAIDEAKKSGAMALFGEKYGSQVRVVSIGDVSKELCGGTHLKETSDVGLLTIVEEGSIASGVRRIEALSAQTALDSLKAEVVRLQQDRERLMKQNKQLEEEKSSLKIKGAV